MTTITTILHSYKITRKTLVGGIVFAWLLTVGALLTPVASASPTKPLEFYGDNPSGKLNKNGAPLTSPGSAAPLRSLKSAPLQTQDSFTAECPKTITCKVVPAAYVANGGNVEDYGNYDKANRPNDMKIDRIVIHDTEGTLASVLEAFQNPTFYASAHYVIDTDGTVYQMVQTKNIAWHAGNWSYNMHSIGIEHVGYAGDSGSYTPAMYKASTELVKYLSKKFDIQRDREHIIGHDTVPGTNPATAAQQHTDPGPFWNWQHYMALLGSPARPTSFKTDFVTIAPIWQRNKQSVTGCSNGTNGCVAAGAQPTNFVSLRTQPRSDAPLFTDFITGQGTSDVNNNSSRLIHGQTVAVASKKIEREGVWYQVWVNGQKAWLYSAWKAPTAFPAKGTYVTPKQQTAVNVYGRAVPERSEYPADLIAMPPGSFYVPTPTPVYTMQPGQKYKLIGNTKTEHFYAWASDASFPYDHTVFRGNIKYLEVQLGNRSGFVKKADITIK